MLKFSESKRVKLNGTIKQLTTQNCIVTDELLKERGFKYATQ